MTSPYTKRTRLDSITVEAILQRDVPANGRGGAQAEIGFAKLGAQEPYFHVLAGEYEPHERAFNTCANHTLFIEKFPAVANLAKWHLAGIRSGPMHYEANAIFWAEMAQGRRERQSYDPDPVEAFKHCVVWGAVPASDVGEPWKLDGEVRKDSHNPGPLQAWLRERKPALMAKFHEEIEAVYPSMWTLAEGL